MQCVKCGADFASDQLRCPYCGTVNEHALQLAKELQQYDKQYETARDTMLATGENLVLKKMTIGVGIAFLAIVLLFGAYVGVYSYRYGAHSKYQVTGAQYEENKKKLKEYMDNKDYIRAYVLASTTDPSSEYFNYYPEYQDELLAIYDYSLILSDVRQTMVAMDEGNNYRSLTPTLVISLGIFYRSPESEVKQELQEEIEMYLRNLYRLTDAEIEELRAMDYSAEFSLDGQEDYEAVSKERMVKYFGK